MQSICVFLDIAKFANFQRKIADISRTQRVYHVIHIVLNVFRKGITVPIFIIVGYVCQILRKGGLFGSSSTMISNEKAHPELS